MMPIDLTIDETGLEHAVQRARERNVVIPTFAQMRSPSLCPPVIKEELSNIGLHEPHPRNLFRITWHNEPVEFGGGFGPPNVVELPSALTGVRARILALVGKWFPIGAHKVGAAFACLVPRLVTGKFDPTRQKAVWPSTGNYCRGGAYDSLLLGCQAVAVVPAGMSKERFAAMEKLGCEVLTVPGSESSVKHLLDECRSLVSSPGGEYVVFNQFDEFANYLWHYKVTGGAAEDALDLHMAPEDEFVGFCAATGSAGTIGAGDYLKQLFPASKVVAVEALQCPTMLENGFGSHNIEGIGDRSVPWIHNVRNTDLVAGIDDRACTAVLRLFNEPAGRAYLASQGVPEKTIGQLELFGLSGIANLLAAIKTARYFELDEHCVLLTVLTDWVWLYRSRIARMAEELGPYGEQQAAIDFNRWLLGQTSEGLLELTYRERRRVHNLKYFIWVEQQGKSEEECRAQWYDRSYWTNIQSLAPKLDDLICEFNRRVGILPG